MYIAYIHVYVPHTVQYMFGVIGCILCYHVPTTNFLLCQSLGFYKEGWWVWFLNCLLENEICYLLWYNWFAQVRERWYVKFMWMKVHHIKYTIVILTIIICHKTHKLEICIRIKNVCHNLQLVLTLCHTALDVYIQPTP